MFGWIGSIMFAFCGLPQAIKTIKEGHARGMDSLFLLMWTFGEVFTLIEVLANSSHLHYLVFNYLANLVFLVVILIYKIFPRIPCQA
jgi:uncharacterized protein with PQ loop repeat